MFVNLLSPQFDSICCIFNTCDQQKDNWCVCAIRNYRYLGTLNPLIHSAVGGVLDLSCILILTNICAYRFNTGILRALNVTEHVYSATCLF